ncbi:CD209 antigen-like protein E isoform X1 [Sander lucioperca]|uniref:CD209 antigen-like protein E n=1 Tax=Sander lucioperca TaxID=283035 RepID=A0A8C9XPK9_SANLU|nr:CD209 antigen-like protein E isoform X1 [Sander lucioperca]
MEGIYANGHYAKRVVPRSTTNQKGPRSSEKRRFHGAVVLCLGLLSVFLLAGLIGLGVHYYDTVQRLQASDYKLSSLTKERDQLNANLTEMTKELNRNKSCPAGWRMFSCACYLLSAESGSWEKGSDDCRERGAHLVVIESFGEQTFLSNFTQKETHAWIGLTDKAKEGTWEWINEAPLSLKYWRKAQPDDGGGHSHLGKEDCAHIIITGGKNSQNWNDLLCSTSLRWICEKMLSIGA